MSEENRYSGNGRERLREILAAVDRCNKMLAKMQSEKGKIVTEGTQAIREGDINGPESQRFMEYAMLYDTVAGLCESADRYWGETPTNVRECYRAFGRISGAKGKGLLDFIELQMKARRNSPTTYA